MKPLQVQASGCLHVLLPASSSLGRITGYLEVIFKKCDSVRIADNTTGSQKSASFQIYECIGLLSAIGIQVGKNDRGAPRSTTAQKSFVLPAHSISPRSLFPPGIDCLLARGAWSRSKKVSKALIIFKLLCDG